MTSKKDISPVVLNMLRGLGAPEFFSTEKIKSPDESKNFNNDLSDIDLVDILDFELNMGFTDDEDEWLVVHAYQILARRRVTAAVPLLIQLLISADEEDDWMLDELPEVIASYGPEVTSQVIQALNLEPPYAQDTWGFVGLIDALKLIATNHLSSRDSICEELRRVLDRCDIFSPTVVGFVIVTLLEMKDPLSIPAIEMAFRRDVVDPTILTWKEVRSEFGVAVPGKIMPENAGNSPGLYRGDEWMERNLLILGSQFRPDNLRFFILGSILQVDMVSPNEQLNEVMTDFDGAPVGFVTSGQANNFVRNFMALWNEVAPYQDQLFELPEIKKAANLPDVDQKIWEADSAMVQHTFWMGCFVDGLSFGDRDDAAFLAPEGRVLVDKIFDFLDVSRHYPSQETMKQKHKLVATLRDDWTRHYLAFANSCRQERFKILAKKKLVAESRHVGRNDPCPCGSGKKFKKCCLM